MNFEQLNKYADILVWGLETSRTKKFRPYDRVLLRYEHTALPLAEEVYKRLIEKKFIVVQQAQLTEKMESIFFEKSDKKIRSFVSPWDKSLYENLNGMIYLIAPSSLTHLKNIDPEKINDTSKARKKIRSLVDTKEEKGMFGWTLCTYPTDELAKQAKCSIEEYRMQIIKACYLNEKDPVKKWISVHDQIGNIKKWLDSLKATEIHLESELSDLKICLGEKRRFKGVSGHNIPSFEIFTSPDWRGSSGVYFANLPSFKNGNYVTGARLEFKNGVIVKSDAEYGAAFLNKMISMDPGAKKIGEFSLTDKRFSKIDRFMADTLFDENFGGDFGNSHIAIGMSYSDTVSVNPAKLTKSVKKKLGLNDSALHWDLVNTEKKRVSMKLPHGEKILIYENGIFKY